MMRKGQVVIYAAFAGIVLAALLTAHFLGLSFYVITGASMTGAIPKGSVAIERRVPASSLQVGDVITFQPPGTKGAVTHRIIAIGADDLGRPVYTTRGDANPGPDPWHFTLDRPDQAKFMTAIPWLGYFLAFFTLRIVRTVFLAAVGLTMLVIVILWYREAPEEAEDDTLIGDGGTS